MKVRVRVGGREQGRAEVRDGLRSEVGNELGLELANIRVRARLASGVGYQNKTIMATAGLVD